MASPKNPGPTLNFEQLGEQTQIPREFIAAMELKESVQSVKNEVLPDALSDTVIFSRIETNRKNERSKHTWFKKPGNITLRDISKNQNGQPVQITRILFPTADVPPEPTATTDVAVKDLGNGWSIQESSAEGFYDDSGMFVEAIFLGPRYEVQRPDAVPDEFKVAVPVTTTEINVAGTAQLPVLLTGDLDRWEQQVDNYIKRTHVESRASIAVPVVLVGKDTNEKKQVVTVTKTYRLSLESGGGLYDAPSALQEVAVQNLGDGRVIQTTRSILAVVQLASYEKSIEDTVPPEFRALSETTRTTKFQPGAADPNLDLTTGELRHTQEQIDLYTLKVDSVVRDTTTSALTDKDIDGVADGEGSRFTDDTTNSKTLQDGSPALVQDILTIDSEVRDLGTGQTVQATKKVGSWPTYSEYETDDRGMVTSRTKTIVGPATANPGGFARKKVLDHLRAVQIIESCPLTDTTKLAQIYPGTIDVDLPPQLTAIAITANASAAGGSVSETGNYALGGTAGSGSISLQGSAKASAGCVLDVSPSINQKWGQNVPCLHTIFPVLRTNTTFTTGFHVAIWNYFFTLLSGGTGAIALALTGTTYPLLNEWPKFNPKEVLLNLSYGHTAVEESLSVHAADSVISDYLGVKKTSGTARTSGRSVQAEIELVQKTVRISPTIHSALNVSIPSTFVQEFNTGSISLTGGNTIGCITSANAQGFCTPSSVAGTPGQATIPTMGLYLYKIFVEYYKKDILLVHFVIVDFADLL